VAEAPTVSLVPGASAPPDDLAGSALAAGGVDADDAGDAAACELDEELEPPQAASAAARPAVARMTPALLLNCNQPV
jgi:hypothetical protein